MRVIAGKYRSRKLKPVPGSRTRPTTDKIKESMFNMAGIHFHGGNVLDLYAGTGALAIEAVSRGMDYAVLCEKQREAIKIIQENIAMTKEPERFKCLIGDNRKKLVMYQQDNPDIQFDLVLIDPPYAQQNIESDILMLCENNLLTKDCLIICETDQQTQLPETIERFSKIKYREYAATALHLYERSE